MDHIGKIENAFVNYLKALNPNPFTPAGLLIFAGENDADKNAARIVAYVEGGQLDDEEPPNSGNRPAVIVVELRTPFSKLTAKEIAAGTLEPLSQHQSNAEALQVAIVGLTDDDLTAAIANFTCMGFYNKSEMYEQSENYWSSGWRIRLLSCPKAFAN